MNTVIIATHYSGPDYNPQTWEVYQCLQECTPEINEDGCGGIALFCSHFDTELQSGEKSKEEWNRQQFQTHNKRQHSFRDVNKHGLHTGW